MSFVASAYKKLPFGKKFSEDVIWNLASFMVLAVCGILANVLIGYFYDAAALGVFNQVFALYIFISQFGAFGFHLSVVRYIPQFSDDEEKCHAIGTTSIILTVLLATIFCALGYIFADYVGSIFDSQLVSIGWLCALPGLWFFCIDKVLLGILNGMREMKSFAVGQALRFFLLTLAIAACAFFQLPGEYLALSITVSEAAVFLFCIFALYKAKFKLRLTHAAEWWKKHFDFGYKSFMSGSIAELNSKIDVLMLGVFLTDHAVGIYSMAAMLMEGIGQLAIVFRNNLNPVIAKQFANKEFKKLEQTVHKGVRLFYGLMALVGVASIAAFPLFIFIFQLPGEFNDSWVPFIILMIGLMACSGYRPFSFILLQAGYPAWHTGARTAILVVNVLGNLVFIPMFGITGAALGTAISFVSSVFILKILTKRLTGLTI